MKPDRAKNRRCNRIHPLFSADKRHGWCLAAVSYSTDTPSACPVGETEFEIIATMMMMFDRVRILVRNWSNLRYEHCPIE
jgi:hypothetical protein